MVCVQRLIIRGFSIPFPKAATEDHSQPGIWYQHRSGRSKTAFTMASGGEWGRKLKDIGPARPGGDGRALTLHTEWSGINGFPHLPEKRPGRPMQSAGYNGR